MSRRRENRVENKAGGLRLVGFVLDQGDDHAVEVEEKQDEVEAKLGEGFLQRPVSHDLSGSRLGEETPNSTFL